MRGKEDKDVNNNTLHNRVGEDGGNDVKKVRQFQT